jgi:hypothetical protein
VPSLAKMAFVSGACVCGVEDKSPPVLRQLAFIAPASLPPPVPHLRDTLSRKARGQRSNNFQLGADGARYPLEQNPVDIDA